MPLEAYATAAAQVDSSPKEAPAVGAALWQALGSERTYGLCFFVFLVPILVWARKTRFAGLLVLAQLAVYVAFYFFVPDPVPYALASFPRLVLHLLPAIITGVALLISSPSAAKDAPRY